ncbi:hypothetical protein AZE42_09644 [Rhizopogon vesiculosus]|uniref:Uncharacterized protein n=1 Tax=Rhizopogon vesiculosus TaxID=180088 RepID=A0A1J8R100_9AGAM|nr:hypothetical protein AZE42_09644 [Rhizopogon vesiculosus]
MPVKDIICGFSAFPTCRVLTASLDYRVKVSQLFLSQLSFFHLLPITLWDLASETLLTAFRFPKLISSAVWDITERLQSKLSEAQAPAISIILIGDEDNSSIRKQLISVSYAPHSPLRYRLSPAPADRLGARGHVDITSRHRAEAISHPGTSTYPSIPGRDYAFVFIRQQLGKAKGINDVMWETAVQKAMAQEKQEVVAERRKGTAPLAITGEPMDEDDVERPRKKGEKMEAKK